MTTLELSYWASGTVRDQLVCMKYIAFLVCDRPIIDRTNHPTLNSFARMQSEAFCI